MSNATETTSATYNPHQLITLRKITDGVESFESWKATDLEGDLDSLRSRANYLDEQRTRIHNQISQITDHMTSDDWYSDMTDKEEILKQLEEILDFTPTATISITATITVSLSADIELSELSDFDADSFLSDNLEVNAYGGSVNVDDWTADSVDWEEA